MRFTHTLLDRGNRFISPGREQYSRRKQLHIMGQYSGMTSQMNLLSSPSFRIFKRKLKTLLLGRYK